MTSWARCSTCGKLTEGNGPSEAFCQGHPALDDSYRQIPLSILAAVEQAALDASPGVTEGDVRAAFNCVFGQPRCDDPDKFGRHVIKLAGVTLRLAVQEHRSVRGPDSDGDA